MTMKFSRFNSCRESNSARFRQVHQDGSHRPASKAVFDVLKQNKFTNFMMFHLNVIM